MQIVEYAKSHPVASGIIAVVGIIVFVMIVRGGGGGEAQGTYAGPSDAEIAANAQIQAAQINAQSVVGAAQVGAGVQINSDNKAAEVAMAQIGVYNNAIAAEKELTGKALDNQQALGSQALASVGQIDRRKKGNTAAYQVAVIQSAMTGQAVAPSFKPGKYNAMGNSQWYPMAGNTIGGAAAGIGSGIASAASGIASIFSDQRLKENIRLAGYDKRGREVYEFNYKGSNRKRLGYIAQSLMRTDPDKVSANKAGLFRIMVPRDG